MRVGRRLATRHGPLDFDDGPLIVGVLNVTPDSFSDGGRFSETAAAVDRALSMVAEGAHVIDIGGCSTRPGSVPPSLDEELGRVLPVLEQLDGRVDVPISVDTWRARVFEEAWERGAAILNDVTALTKDERLGPAVAERDAPVVLMHMAGTPATMQERPRYDDVTAEVKAFFVEALDRASKAGVSSSRVVLDPGIGFGKTIEHNLELLRNVEAFRELGRPLFVGTSRKSFLGAIVEREDPGEREFATAATTAHLCRCGVEMIRVHDVRAARDVVAVTRRLCAPSKN